jgi:ketosteroid isomerase-like protein
MLETRKLLGNKLIWVLAVFSAGCRMVPTVSDSNGVRQEQVRRTELAFADSMKQRDLDKFSSFIADDAVFFSKSSVLRGKLKVIAGWKNLFADKAPPFSWRPETVEVLERGDLALSTGPVYGNDGALIATFTSIWRLDRDGQWKIVFDKGNPVSKPSEMGRH